MMLYREKIITSNKKKARAYWLHDLLATNFDLALGVLSLSAASPRICHLNFFMLPTLLTRDQSTNQCNSYFTYRMWIKLWMNVIVWKVWRRSWKVHDCPAQGFHRDRHNSYDTPTVCMTQISVSSFEFMDIQKGFLNLKSSKYSIFWLGYTFKENEQDRVAEVHG